jgi:DNA-binding XRE family transcriptional regulator
VSHSLSTRSFVSALVVLPQNPRGGRAGGTSGHYQSASGWVGGSNPVAGAILSATPAMAPIAKLAAKLKRLRQRAGLSQEELAAAAGISRTYLSRLETAMHDPTLGVVERLAKALKVKPTDLLK